MTRYLPALLLCLVALGCTSSLDNEDAVRDIRAEYEKQTSLKLPDLECEEAEAEVGETFECTGRNSSDVDITIGGEVKKVDGSKANYEWKVVNAVAPGTIFAEEGKRQLEQNVGQETKSMTCPDKVRVRKDETVRCELVTMDDMTYGVTLKLTDDKGAFDVEVDQEPKS